MIPSVFLLAASALLCWAVGRSVRRHHHHSLRTAARKHAGCRPFRCRYPHVDKLLGLDLVLEMWRDFAGNPGFSDALRRRHESCGPTFLANNLGAACVYTVEPENIRTVTTLRFDDYAKASWVREARKHVGDGVLMNDGERWKRSRASLKPLFARSSLDEPALLEPHVSTLIGVIQDADSVPFDFREVAGRFMLDTVTDFLYGEPTHSLHGKDAVALEFLQNVHRFESIAAAFIAVGPLAWFKLLFQIRQALGLVAGMKAFFDFKLRRAIGNLDEGEKAQPEARKGGANILRGMKAQGISDEQIQAEVQNIFFASYDTTTALLSNLFDILGRRPDVQNRIRREVEELRGRRPSNHDLSKMQHLRFTIWETIRLFSPVTFHSRQAIRDTVLPSGGGPRGTSPVFVPKGTEITWSTYALNRSPDIYGPDSLAFRPERWETLRPGGHFMPFGSGPRQCMGQQMVLVEVAYVTVRLLQAFATIESRDERPFREAKAVSFYNANGTVLSMAGRGIGASV